jgi:uncharacterized protein YlxW (UPF0749 family)
MSEHVPEHVAPEPNPTARSAWGRLWRAGRPRASRAQALAGVLTLLLGFAVVTQVRQTQQTGLSTLRQDDLVNVLDDVNQRETRLQDDARQLQETQQRLRSGSDSSQAALEAAQARLDTLGILTGTKTATGPGIRLIVSDPQDKVSAATLLDTLEELRDAGAEALQIGTVRVVASTWLLDAADATDSTASGGSNGSNSSSAAGSNDAAGIVVDGTTLRAPYILLAIGDPQTLAAALDIPGGVLETLRSQQADGTVTSEQQVAITALHSVTTPRYARPAPTPSGSAGG